MAIIFEGDTSSAIYYGDVTAGSVFEYDDCIYMKTTLDGKFMDIDLSDLEITYSLEDKELVTLLHKDIKISLVDKA